MRKLVNLIRDLYRINRKYLVEGFQLHKYRSGIDFSSIYGQIHKEYSPYFVLSTGRTGTQFLTKILSKDKNLSVYHSPQPELVYYSRFAYEHNVEKSEVIQHVFDAARYELLQNKYILRKTYIETNNRITFFAPQVAVLFPESRFIHIIRHPASFVRSGISRNRKWYSGKNEHDVGRIVPKDMPSSEWDKWDAIQKITWLWNETNAFIERFKEIIHKNRILTIRCEDLFEDPHAIQEIQQFIGSKVFSIKNISKFIQKPVNKSNNYKIPEYQNWNEEDIRTFKSVVSKELVELYRYEI